MLFSSWSWSSAISKLLPLSCKPSTFLQFCSLLSHFQRIFGFWESKPLLLYFERCILYFRCCMWYFMVYFVYGITKYTIKYHIQHLKYKIQRSKYNIAGLDSQNPRIRWGRDDWRKVLQKILSLANPHRGLEQPFGCLIDNGNSSATTKTLLKSALWDEWSSQELKMTEMITIFSSVGSQAQLFQASISWGVIGKQSDLLTWLTSI